MMIIYPSMSAYLRSSQRDTTETTSADPKASDLAVCDTLSAVNSKACQLVQLRSKTLLHDKVCIVTTIYHAWDLRKEHHHC